MILVTGAAGFIGFHVARRLLEKGHTVVGVDNLSAYYDRRLKADRLRLLTAQEGFRFVKLDICHHEALCRAVDPQAVQTVVHLAAQAGVRHSLEKPFAFGRSNLLGHLSILEFCRKRQTVSPRLLYASSSSVYGGSRDYPFSEDSRVDKPVSLYAATKRADELMSESYSALYGLRQIGLRLFTVYGPWGRPDMAYWHFTRQILRGEPIQLFNNGQSLRDFTYVDDVVTAIVAMVERQPATGADIHRIYNIGNNKPEKLTDFVAALEAATGRQAVVELGPMQPGDVEVTHADISRIQVDFDFRPTTGLAEGLQRFVSWYRNYTG